MILVDEATGNSQPLWSDGSASLPAGARAPGWYPGQTRTFTSMRMPPVGQGFVDKGSADSLVESVSSNSNVLDRLVSRFLFFHFLSF